jgi:hypothetical protein
LITKSINWRCFVYCLWFFIWFNNWLNINYILININCWNFFFALNLWWILFYSIHCNKIMTRTVSSVLSNCLFLFYSIYNLNYFLRWFNRIILNYFLVFKLFFFFFINIFDLLIQTLSFQVIFNFYWFVKLLLCCYVEFLFKMLFNIFQCKY